jgi:hypothetical protein
MIRFFIQNLSNNTNPFLMKNKILFLIFSYLTLAQQYVYSQNKLNSFPSASAAIFLDFDGEEVNSPVWNNGNPFTAAASGLSDDKVTEIFNRVSEDYRPFNVTITTDENVFLAAPVNKRIRVIITPTSGWYPGVGGVSYVGSFTWGDDTPGFVFCDKLGPDNTKEVAECCSHESGHSLGLSHQSKYDATCNLTAKYNDGVGEGEIAWAPIMGNSYFRNMMVLLLMDAAMCRIIFLLLYHKMVLLSGRMISAMISITNQQLLKQDQSILKV